MEKLQNPAVSIGSAYSKYERKFSASSRKYNYLSRASSGDLCSVDSWVFSEIFGESATTSYFYAAHTNKKLFLYTSWCCEESDKPGESTYNAQRQAPDEIACEIEDAEQETHDTRIDNLLSGTQERKRYSIKSPISSNPIRAGRRFRRRVNSAPYSQNE